MRLQQNEIHTSWYPLITKALACVDYEYLQNLENTTNWLPNRQNLFNAFQQPLENCRYILFGETPYPRAESANGYAFWDAAVTDIWSESGLSKTVNRATSLRNFLKMLLVAEGLLIPPDLDQSAIAKIDKTNLVRTNDELFSKLLDHGFVLLNASLVLKQKQKRYDARAWSPFIESLLTQLAQQSSVFLILFGKIAQDITQYPTATRYQKLIAEHPYNLSFITNQSVIKFFRPFHLLRR